MSPGDTKLRPPDEYLFRRKHGGPQPHDLPP